MGSCDLPFPHDAVLFLRRFSMCPQSQLDCPECELYTKNAPMKFLQDLKDVLNLIYMDHCPQKSPAGG